MNNKELKNAITIEFCKNLSKVKPNWLPENIRLFYNESFNGLINACNDKEPKIYNYSKYAHNMLLSLIKKNFNYEDQIINIYGMPDKLKKCNTFDFEYYVFKNYKSMFHGKFGIFDIIITRLFLYNDIYQDFKEGDKLEIIDVVYCIHYVYNDYCHLLNYVNVETYLNVNLNFIYTDYLCNKHYNLEIDKADVYACKEIIKADFEASKKVLNHNLSDVCLTNILSNIDGILMNTPMKGIDGKYHYVYKITNSIDKKYYIGKHSTDNLDDGYMGSGKEEKAFQKLHGIDKFKKEYIKFFPTSLSAELYESNKISKNKKYSRNLKR